MIEKDAKKLYTKMIEDKMLPESFCGTWSKDKSRFLNWINLDSKIGLDYGEYVEDYGDDEEY